MAYQVLDPFTFNVLNQTKTLSAALCCYLVMGWKQSRIQIVALILLLVAALIIEGAVPLTLPTLDKIASFGQLILSRFTTASVAASSSYTRHFTQGVLPVLLASFLSGLAGALSQKNLQCNNRNSYLFSMELCAASSIILIASMCLSEDGKTLYQNGFFQNWTWGTIIPIFTNSVGGIVVGLVTKHAGSVQKGFALVFGICLSGIMQALISTDDGSRITQEQVIGGSLAAVSLLMHCMNPYVPIKRVSGVPDEKNLQDNVAAAISIKRKSRKED
jgi:UDP-sugar transporter A1/2/3